jgi:hypothetical protein
MIEIFIIIGIINVIRMIAENANGSTYQSTREKKPAPLPGAPGWWEQL